mgnify:CR=1 FL=1
MLTSGQIGKTTFEPNQNKKHNAKTVAPRSKKMILPQNLLKSAKLLRELNTKPYRFPRMAI